MRRYTILARPADADYEIELAHVDSNPEAVTEGARRIVAAQIKTESKTVSLYRYEHVRIRINQPDS